MRYKDESSQKGRAHETDDLHTRLRRRSDAGARRPGRGPQRRIRARRMGAAAPRRRGRAYVAEVFQRAEAFLFGRRTYEIFAGYWGVMEDSDNPIASALNTRPKYVASTTITDPQWSDTRVLSGDVAAAVGELKATAGGELQVHGSGALVRSLLEKQLVDEITLLVYPVVVGQGARLFPDIGPDAALDLVESRTTPKGVAIHVYRPAGRPKHAGS